MAEKISAITEITLMCWILNLQSFSGDQSAVKTWSLHDARIHHWFWQWLANLDQRWPYINTLRPRQNGRHFTYDIFKCIFLNENASIAIKISLKFVPKGPINNIPALVQIMAWRRPGDKPLSEPMMVNLLTHICVTRPQWVNSTARNKLTWNWNVFFLKGNMLSPAVAFDQAVMP